MLNYIQFSSACIAGHMFLEGGVLFPLPPLLNERFYNHENVINLFIFKQNMPQKLANLLLRALPHR